MFPGKFSAITDAFRQYGAQFCIFAVFLLSAAGSFIPAFHQCSFYWQLIPFLTAALALFFFQIAMDPLKNNRFRFTVYALVGCLLSGTVIYSMFRYCRMLNQPDFCDEMEKFSVSYLLCSGQRIYDDFFCHHGPVTFMFSHLWYAICPSSNTAVLRIIGILVYTLPGVFLLSGYRKCFYKSLFSAFGYWTAIALIWEFWSMLGIPYHHGGVVMYQAYTGIFLGISLACIVPYLMEETISRTRCFWCGFFVVFSFFTAVSAAIGCFCLVLAAVLKWLFDVEKRKNFSILLWCVCGGIVSTAVVMLYLFCFGSIAGFFEYHILFNFLIYRYTAGGVCNIYLPLTVFLNTWQFPLKSLNYFTAITTLADIVLYVCLRNKTTRKGFFFTVISAVLLFLIIIYSSTRYMVLTFHGATAAVCSVIFFFALLAQLKTKKMFAVGCGFLVMLGLFAFWNDFGLIYQKKTPDQENPIVNDFSDHEDKIFSQIFNLYALKRKTMFDVIVFSHVRPYFDHQILLRRPEIIESLEKQEVALINASAIIQCYRQYGDPAKWERLCRALEQNYCSILGTTWSVSRKRSQEKAEMIKRKKYKIIPIHVEQVVPEQADETRRSIHIVKFNGVWSVFQLKKDGTAEIRSKNFRQKVAGTVNLKKNHIAAAGKFLHGEYVLLWQFEGTDMVFLQRNLLSFQEVNSQNFVFDAVNVNCRIFGSGDFIASGTDALLLVEKTGMSSDPRGLIAFACREGERKFHGWLGALVNSWYVGAPLSGNLNDPADINAKNAMFDLKGIGDFNGDGRDDLIIQNTMPPTVNGHRILSAGDVYIFVTGDKRALQAGTPPGVTIAGRIVGSWKVISSGDFDGDKTDDILLQDSSNLLVAWKMKDGKRVKDLCFGICDANETVIGTADFNGDGTDDIVLYNKVSDKFYVWVIVKGALSGFIELK